MLLWGRKVWNSVDEAIRESTAAPVNGARAIDYTRFGMAGGGEESATALDAQSRVKAAIGRFSADEQALLVFYAHRFSYADLAKGLRMRKGSAILRHRQARKALAARLVKIGLLVE